MLDPVFKTNPLDVIARIRKCASGPLNHHDIQHLFGVKRARAFELLKMFGAQKGVAGLFIDRDVLEQRLQDLARYYETESAVIRRQRFDERMALYRQARAGLFADYPIQVNRGICSARADSLPATIRFEPGRLVIEHKGAEDLASQLLVIGQAAVADFPALAERIENPEPDKARAAGS